MNRALFGGLACLCGTALAPLSFAQESLPLRAPWQAGLAPSQSISLSIPVFEPGSTYTLDAGLLTAGLSEGERVRVEVRVPGMEAIANGRMFFGAWTGLLFGGHAPKSTLTAYIDSYTMTPTGVALLSRRRQIAFTKGRYRTRL